MECPLFSRDGKRRKLETIEFDDIEGLREIDEGYSVEYKSSLNNDVKKKIPKIIASFANASGGWIFIGIDDSGEYVGIRKERTDFNQVLSQIVHRHVMPFPLFRTRFIRDENSPDNKGVLIVEVLEGTSPPYIADGNVYLRIGSSSDHMEKADNFALIDLSRKERRYREEIDAFCVRDIYLPPAYISFDGMQHEPPVVDIYLKRIVFDSSGMDEINPIDKTIGLMQRLYVQEGLGNGCYCQNARRSLIFKNRLGVVTDEIGPMIELFYDGSIKVVLPVPYVQELEQADLIDELQLIRPIHNVGLIRMLNGKVLLTTAFTVCDVVEKYLDERRRSVTDYAVSTEFERMQGMLVVSDCEAYRKYVEQFGYPNIGTLDGKTKTWVSGAASEDCGTNLTLRHLVMPSLMGAMGLPVFSADIAKINAALDVMGFDNSEEVF